MELPKNENAKKLFVKLFVKAVNQDGPFSPVSLFAEDIKDYDDDVAVAQALSLLTQYCVVYRSGSLAGKWQRNSFTIQKYKEGYYRKYGIT